MVENSSSEVTETAAKQSKSNAAKNAGTSSYSAIAINCKQEHSPWATLNAAANQMQRNRLTSEQSSEHSGETSILDTLHTNLGDVLAQALSQKKDKKAAVAAKDSSNASNAGKKSKKSKKMLPLFSTGMNFGGN